MNNIATQSPLRESVSQLRALMVEKDQTQWLPKSAINVQVVTSEGGGVTIYKYELAGGFYALAFVGKQGKPHWHLKFGSEEAREKRANAAIAGAAAHAAEKASRAQERKSFKHDFKVGDIFVASWGYDQTNVNYFQAVEIKGKSVVVREIASKSVNDHQVTAVKDSFVGDPLVRRAGQSGIKINSTYNAYKWDGKPSYETPFGQGH